MTTDPSKHSAQPNFPNTPSISLRKYELRTALCHVSMRFCTPLRRDPYPIRTLSAPRGVTRMAGAKAYAAKLATSPRATMSRLASPDVKSGNWCPYVSLYHPTTRDSSNMRILRPQTHVVRRPASNPVFRRISDSAPMIVALDRNPRGVCPAHPGSKCPLPGKSGTPTFLVITKLVPMAMVDTMARRSPTYL